MNRALTKTLFASLCILGVAGPAGAQQREDYCDTLKMLLASAKDGFARAQNFKMAGAATCNLQSDTRSYGCMWTFDKSSWTAAGYQKAVQGANACFPNVAPKQSRQRLIERQAAEPTNRDEAPCLEECGGGRAAGDGKAGHEEGRTPRPGRHNTL